MSKKLTKIRLTSTNGDIHYIDEEDYSSEWIIEEKDCDKSEAIKTSKLEASKLLLLIRA